MRVGDGSELAFSRSEPALSNRSGSMTWMFSGGCFRRHLQVVKFLKTDSHIRQKLHWRLWRTDGQARFQTLGPSPSLVLRPPSARRPSVAHAPRLSCAPRSFPCMPSVCASFRLVRVACARPAYRALPARILVLRLAFVLVTCPRSARRASNLRLRTHFCYHVLPSRQGGGALREYLAVPLLCEDCAASDRGPDKQVILKPTGCWLSVSCHLFPSLMRNVLVSSTVAA